MSLTVGGYPHGGYSHPGPMGVPSTHEFYAPQYPTAVTQVRYPDYNDRAYFHNWVLSGTPDLSVSPESYAAGTPSPGDMHPHIQFETYTNGFGERCIKRKVNASKKERRRTQSINNAFSQLRDCIPNVPSDTKLSKIKTLRLAISYIAYLMDVLDKDDPKLSEKGFKAEISRKRERHDEKRKLEIEAEMGLDTSNKDKSTPEKKDKTRSGWPEHVWASELKPAE